MVLGETSRGATRFWVTSSISSATSRSCITGCDDDVDADAYVINGDLVEVVHDGLPVEPAVEPELEPESALPLGCRWRVPLTRVHNPSVVLLLYRD